ncbi:hypothetical protein H2202_004811 [Exophiala xenobiotica]|nr:hypothetical protein H2202_004811 [Exophiala xenobiotica]KAK5237828.1 hypothetical protein LTR47_000921 [Exophiala xenobiotica]KAK5250959.1 hypothetical protein LTS06_004289 [Exophiala xenobiotica]KAK5355580.1 hypothetical protein LTR61_001253 [Exophiala xenobiotica]KAK5385523.1 hypothetical protein LTR11_001896 [Exophiala xenobiotica]
MDDNASMAPPKSQNSDLALNAAHALSPTDNSIPADSDAKHQPSSLADGDSTSLCKLCHQLGLSVDKFVMPDDVPTSAYNPNKSMRPDSNTNTPGLVKSAMRSGAPPFKLGSLWDIQRRQHHCVLCNLLAQSVEQRDLNKALKQHGPELLQLAQCELSWEIDGREYLDTATGLIKNRTRRLRAQWSHPALQQSGSYLVFVAPEQEWRPNSEVQASSRREVHFLGRSIDPHKGRTALIKSWLDLCRYHHNEHCQDKYEGTEEFEKMLGESYFGVLDVVNMQLCVLPHVRRGNSFTHEPYVALSYVWGQPEAGKPQPYVTLRENILLHQNHGGLQGAYHDFPKAIKEAIDLVPRLGMRYIWIDSLCIVQDSFRSWNLNARIMHMIYGFASLTICAADGEDSSTGLEAIYADSANQIQGNCAPGVTLMISRPPETAIRGSRWNQRAWTFQERLLSRRCVIFAEKRVYFQCRSASMSQDIYAHGRGTAWSLDSIHAPLQMLKELRVRAIWFYIKCVSMYTSRQLTKSRDILAAFNGVTTLIQQVMRAPFVFSLPSSHFDLALLWQPKGKIRPRVVKDEGDKAFEVEFPTWAWCGWTGAHVDYETDLLNDCLANVHEWLVNHTWICYYIRDDQGNLRPLWDKFRAEDDQSSEARWRGYRGKHTSYVPVAMRTVPPRPPKHTQHSESHQREKERRYDRSSRTLVDKDTFREGQRLAERLKQHHRESNPPSAADLRHYRSTSGVTASDAKIYSQNSLFPKDSPSRRLEREYSEPRHRARSMSSSSSSTERGSRRPDRRKRFLARRSPSDSLVTEEFVDIIYPTYRIVEDPTYFTEAKQRKDYRPVFPLPLEGPQEQRRRRYQVNQDYRETPPEEFDIFGRAFWDEIRTRPQNDFFRTIPENPFRVLKAAGGYSGNGDKDQSYQNKLQFWTWQTTLQVCRASETSTTTTSSPRLDGTGLCRCDIMDDLGDWCGSIVVNESWIDEECAAHQEDHHHHTGGVAACDFIALSEAKSFSDEECPVWTYYIPKERHESEWDVFYVLLVKYHPKSAVWQRVALGKVFRAAFSFGEDGWQEIILG